MVVDYWLLEGSVKGRLPFSSRRTLTVSLYKMGGWGVGRGGGRLRSWLDWAVCTTRGSRRGIQVSKDGRKVTVGDRGVWARGAETGVLRKTSASLRGGTHGRPTVAQRRSSRRTNFTRRTAGGGRDRLSTHVGNPPAGRVSCLSAPGATRGA